MLNNLFPLFCLFLCTIIVLACKLREKAERAFYYNEVVSYFEVFLSVCLYNVYV